MVDAAGIAHLVQVSADFSAAAARAVEGLATHLWPTWRATPYASGHTPGRLGEADVPGLCLAVTILVATSRVDRAESKVADKVLAAREEAQRIAGSVLGEDLLAELVQLADDELAGVVVSSFGVEQQRAVDAVARLGASVGPAEHLRSCARRVDDLRFAAQLPARWEAESEMGGER